MEEQQKKIKPAKINPHWISLIFFALLCVGLLVYQAFTGLKNHTPDVSFESGTPTLSVSFIDVGEGDCTLIKTPSGKAILIDTGVSDHRVKVMKYLEKMQVKSLDYMILTHAHDDHAGLAAELLDQLEVKSLIIAAAGDYSSIIQKAKEKELTPEICRAGTHFDCDGAEFFFLSDGSEEKQNDNSCIMTMMKFGEKVFLFTGDAEAKLEKDVINLHYNLRADVLKVGHHGSNTSTSEALLQAVNPKIAVISVGADNSFGHPDSVVLKRLEGVCEYVLRTDLSGDVVIVTDGEKIQILSEK